jgi:hypothetical protein
MAPKSNIVQLKNDLQKQVLFSPLVFVSFLVTFTFYNTHSSGYCADCVLTCHEKYYPSTSFVRCKHVSVSPSVLPSVYLKAKSPVNAW